VKEPARLWLESARMDKSRQPRAKVKGRSRLATGRETASAASTREAASIHGYHAAARVTVLKSSDLGAFCVFSTGVHILRVT